MKKLYIFLCLFIIGTGIYAQNRDSQSILDKLIWDDEMLNIMLDTRVDFDTQLNNGDLDDLTFRGQTFKLWIVGEIIPGIRYRVRHRLNRPQTPLREGYSAATDQAWLAFDIKNNWTITVGKQSVQFGTFEYDYNPADIYLPTMAFNDLDAYKTGVNIAYSFSRQRMNFQVVNSDAPQFADESYKNKALAFLLLWEGDLFNEALRTRWGYGALQHRKDKFYQWLTLGTQLNIHKFTSELDYYLGARDMDYSDVVNYADFGSRYVHDQSLSLNLKYNFGKWYPSVKGVWNQRYDKNFDRTAYIIKGLEAVMEFYPFTGLLKDLRFHTSYYYTNTKFMGEFENLSHLDSHTFLIGTRWLFKVK